MIMNEILELEKALIERFKQWIKLLDRDGENTKEKVQLEMIVLLKQIVEEER